jgi:hypothetical protein
MMLLIVSGAWPTFLTWTICELLVVASAWLPKASELGDKLIIGPLLMPAPSKTIV